MGIFYRNRTMAGNISLVVFLAFLVTLTLGFPGASAAVTPAESTFVTAPGLVPDEAAVQDKSGSWKYDGETANLRTTDRTAKAVDIKIQLITPESFDNVVLKIIQNSTEFLNSRVGDLDPSSISSAVYKVYGTVYSTVYYVYQFIYHWVYSSGLDLDNDYKFEIYSPGSTKLASITLDLETPPPSGGGGGGGGGITPTTTTTSTNTGTVTTTGGTSTLTADAAKVDAVIADPSKTAVELTVPAAANVTAAVVQVAADQLSKAFEAGKEVAVTFRGVELAFAPEAIDLTPFAGQNATVKFEIKKVDQTQVAGTTGTAFKVAGEVYELNIRVLVGDEDKGGIRSFSKPVEVKLPYDPAKLGGASEDSLAVYRFNEATDEWDYVGGKVDKTTRSVSVSLSSFSKYAVMAYQKTFADLAGHWARADVELMASRRIVAGMTDTTFGPELNVTRAQFATFLQRSLSLAPDESAAAQFADVQSGSWYAGAVGAAAKAGLVKGYEDGSYRPDRLITRQEIAVMVTRALAYSGKAVSLTPAEVDALLARFSDIAQIGDWAREAVAVAVKGGIVHGRAADLYDPGSNATRAEAVVMLKRMLTSTGAL